MNTKEIPELTVIAEVEIPLPRGKGIVGINVRKIKGGFRLATVFPDGKVIAKNFSDEELGAAIGTFEATKKAVIEEIVRRGI